MGKLWTAAKLERAYAVSRKDGPALVPNDWDQGFAAGKLAAEAGFAAERDALAALVDSVAMMEPPQLGVLQQAIEDVAVRLAIAIAGSAGLDRGLLAERATAAAAMIEREWGQPTLRFNPDDFQLLADHAFDRPVLADPTVPKGSVRATAGDAWAADGVAEAIERVSWMIDL